MSPEADDFRSPRLDRLLRARAARVPSGLSHRVFEASVGMLPGAGARSGVLARISWRWVAAAAVLVLAGGLTLRLGGASASSEESESMLAAVIDSRGDDAFGDELGSIAEVRGGGYADLDAEMRLVLASGRIDG